MPTRNASAVWEGGLQDGKGTFTGESGGIGGAYTVGSRFQDAEGSAPEELLAAAEAACFSMALSGNLQRAGFTPRRIETKAACAVEKVGEGWKITTMKLTVRANVPNVDAAKFQELAMTTKDTCPVSQAFKGNVRIDVDAQLV